MSIWGKLKVKAEELLGRAEQVYGESHGDAAATAAGEAHIAEAEAEEAALWGEPHRHNAPTNDDDGLTGAR